MYNLNLDVQFVHSLAILPENAGFKREDKKLP